MWRELQRKTARVAEAVERPSARVLCRCDAVLPLIEKRAGLLAVAQVDAVLHLSFAHRHLVWDLAVNKGDALIEPLE